MYGCLDVCRLGCQYGSSTEGGSCAGASGLHNAVGGGGLVGLSLVPAAARQCFFFFLNVPAPPEISPLPLHAPLPICSCCARRDRPKPRLRSSRRCSKAAATTRRPTCSNRRRSG